jgi:hypothetical protein
MKSTGGTIVLLLAVTALGIAPACNIFETRTPESPSQSGFQYLPRTFPGNVILNLRTAVGQKDVAGYMACISSPTNSQQTFTFVPSADAAEIYAAVLRDWTYQQEQAYFENLVARRRQPQSFSNLAMFPKDSVVGSDTRTYSYDYILTFEHTEPSFTQAVRGSVQLTLVNENSQWTISHWVDLKTTNELTWSSFKGKFST